MMRIRSLLLKLSTPIKIVSRKRKRKGAIHRKVVQHSLFFRPFETKRNCIMSWISGNMEDSFGEISSQWKTNWETSWCLISVFHIPFRCLFVDFLEAHFWIQSYKIWMMLCMNIKWRRCFMTFSRSSIIFHFKK